MQKPISIFFSFVLCVGCALASVGCDGKDDVKTPDENGGNSVVESIDLVSDGVSDYTLVCQTELSNDIKFMAASLRTATGASFRTGTNAYTKAHEIIIGTGRDCEAAVKGLLHGYVIKAVGERIIIAGTDICWTVLGMEAFMREVRSRSGSSSISFPGSLNIVEDPEDAQLIATFLREERKFTLEAESVGVCKGDNVIKYAQGAASDGKYVFFALRAGEDPNGIVYKYTLHPFALVDKTGVFSCYHANDMTYDSRRKKMIVAHSSGDPYGYTLLDVETMERTEVKTSFYTSGIAYNAKDDVFGITHSGSKYMLSNADFNKTVKDYGRSDGMSDTYCAQGMGSDDSYVYFPMSPKKDISTDNVLVVYGWDGKYIDTLHLPITYESETMFYAAGDYYIVFNRGGASLYRLIPVISFDPSK